MTDAAAGPKPAEASPPRAMKLGERLVDSGLVTPDQLNLALRAPAH